MTPHAAFRYWAFLGICLTLLSIGAFDEVQADVYQWKDEQGKTHFTDDPATIPKSQRPQAEADKKPDLPPRAVTKPDEYPLDEWQPAKNPRSPGISPFDPPTSHSAPAEENTTVIGYRGQNANSKWIEVYGGGLKRRNHKVIFFLKVRNTSKVPIWVGVKIPTVYNPKNQDSVGTATPTRSYQIVRVAPGRGIHFTNTFLSIIRGHSAHSKIDNIQFSQPYVVRVKVSQKRFSPNNTPDEKHAIKFAFNRQDKKSLHQMVKTIENETGTTKKNEEKLNSKWVELVSKTFNVPKRTVVTFILGLKLKNISRRKIWVQVNFKSSDPGMACSTSHPIPRGKTESFFCNKRHPRNFLPTGQMPVEIKIFSKDPASRVKPSPEEVLKTYLQTG